MKENYNIIGKNKLIIKFEIKFPRPPLVFFDVSGSDIILNKEVSFSSGVQVWTHSHQFNKKNWRDLPIIKSNQPTILDDYCFIGVNSIILYKCKVIGKYSVIGAGSVVLENIPEFEIWAGNPAKKIGGS